MNAEMDRTTPAPHAIVIHANYASFTPGKIIRFEQVQSRMLLWCKSGKGMVTVNDQKYAFKAGSFLFIPWNHSIYYRADDADPFLVAGIHLVPLLKRSGHITYHTFHTPCRELPEYRERKDVHLSDFITPLASSFSEGSPLEFLAEYIVTWFQRQPREEFMARHLAQTLLYELHHFKNNPSNPAATQPQALRQMMELIDRNAEGKVGISDLAQAADCSPSTVFRLFREQLKCSPVHWILRRKIAHASELLRKTNLRLGEIGVKVCIENPYYFSRVFRKIMGITARDYRNKHSLVISAQSSEV